MSEHDMDFVGDAFLTNLMLFPVLLTTSGYIRRFTPATKPAGFRRRRLHAEQAVWLSMMMAIRASLQVSSPPLVSV